MTALDGRPNTALLVIDVQNGVLAAAAVKDGVIANIGGLVASARAAGRPLSRPARAGWWGPSRPGSGNTPS